MHDIDSEMKPSKYRSSKAYDYVTADDILKDTDYIDSPFFVYNMSQI